MILSTVGNDGQTTVPLEVRDALGIRPGDRVVYEIEAGVVRIRSARGAVEALYGAFARPEMPPQDLDEVRDRYQTELAKHVVAGMAPGEQEG